MDGETILNNLVENYYRQEESSETTLFSDQFEEFKTAEQKVNTNKESADEPSSSQIEENWVEIEEVDRQDNSVQENLIKVEKLGGQDSLAKETLDKIEGTGRRESEIQKLPTGQLSDSAKSEQPTTSEALKKKKGRPRKSTYQNKKPTRESQRKRKCPELINYEEPKSSSLWTDAEKTLLLKTIEEFGIENIKALQSRLKKKTENEIKNQIKMWQTFAATDLQKKLMTEKKKQQNALVNCVSKLDEWIEHFESITDVPGERLFALSNVFLMISEFGKFPDPSECSGIDFRAMYRYVHCMLNGTPFYGVNQATADALNDSISHMFAMVRDFNRVNSLKCQLQAPNYISKHPRCRTYARPSNRGPSLSRNPEAVLHLPDMNPLQFPPHELLRPDADLGESSDDDEIINHANGMF